MGQESGGGRREQRQGGAVGGRQGAEAGRSDRRKGAETGRSDRGKGAETGRSDRGKGAETGRSGGKRAPRTDRFPDELEGGAQDLEALLGARLLVLVRVHEHRLAAVVLLHVLVRRVRTHAQNTGKMKNAPEFWSNGKRAKGERLIRAQNKDVKLECVQSQRELTPQRKPVLHAVHTEHLTHCAPGTWTRLGWDPFAIIVVHGKQFA